MHRCYDPRNHTKSHEDDSLCPKYGCLRVKYHRPPSASLMLFRVSLHKKCLLKCLLCATSVFFVTLWLCFRRVPSPRKTQRTQRSHREKAYFRTFCAKPFVCLFGSFCFDARSTIHEITRRRLALPKYGRLRVKYHTPPSSSVMMFRVRSWIVFPAEGKDDLQKTGRHWPNQCLRVRANACV